MKEFIVQTDMDLNGVVEFEGAGGISFKPHGELIRCGSCVYCKKFNDLWYQPIKDTHVCKIRGLETTPLDYCSKAERIKE